MSENANTCSPLAPCDHENPKPRPAKARLYGDEEVTLHWQVANPWTEQAVMPPFTVDDLDYVPFLEQPDRDVPRRIATAAHVAGQHEERHTFWHHPMCYHCHGDEVLVNRRLVRWMVLNPGKAVPEGDPALPVLPSAAEASSEFLSPAAVRALATERATWLVDGVLPAGRHGIIRGRDASFKSFFALDLCLHLAAGQDWQDRTTSQGRVLYLAGEGVQSFGDRFDSWEATHGDLNEDEQDQIMVRNGTVDLHGAGPAYDRLLAFVRDWQPRVIVADTLQRSAGAGDQNSASDMAVVRERMAALQKAAGTDCTTVLVAHTTKGNGDTRGSSSIEDDADFVLACDRSDMKLTVEVAKQKDGPDGFDLTMQARVVGKSLAITKPGALLEEDAATKNATRVKAALRLAYGGDPLSIRQTWQAVTTDTQGGEISEATVRRTVLDLLTAGVVVEAGKRGQSTLYAIHTDHLSTGHPRKTTPDTKEN